MIAGLSCSHDWKDKLRSWLNEEGQAIRSPVDFAVVASGGRYKPAAHHTLLNEYLLRVASGEIKKLMICMPPRHGKCLGRDTKVLMASGEWKNIQDIQLGDSIVSLNSSYKFEPDMVISKINSGIKQTHEVVLSNGFRIIATYDHRIHTFDGWKNVGDLSQDDYVTISRTLPQIEYTPNTNLSKEEAIILAAWLADGSKTQNGMYISKNPGKISDLIIESTTNLGWNIKRVGNNPNQWGFYISANGKRLGHTPVNFLKQCGLYKTSSKDIHIPSDIFQASRDVVSLFLNVLFGCDGAICKKAQIIEYTSKSFDLAVDIQRILMRFDIRSKISSKQVQCQSGLNTYYRLAISDAESIIKFDNNIGMVSKENELQNLADVARLRKRLNSKSDTFPPQWRNLIHWSPGYYRKHYNIRIDKPGTTHRDKVLSVAILDNNESLIHMATGDVGWSKVTSINKNGLLDTYDIEVQNNHNFIAEGIITHNSMTTSEYFPAWYLGCNPDKNVILSSYESDFAASWGRKVRTLIEEHGTNLFVKNIQTRKDSRAANRWEILKHGGGMYTAGAGGALTGRGAELIIIDDLFKNAEEAASETIRNKVWDWYQSTLLTRLHPGGSIILINTRWHTDDLSGRLLAQEPDQWTVINLPALAEENDPLGRAPGDPLWPEWYSLDDLMKIKNSISSYFWNALYQQHPFDKTGGLFQPEWFKIVDDYPRDCRLVRFWDFAASEGKGDYTANALIGVKNGMCYVIEVDRFQGSPATVENRLDLTSQRDGKSVPIRWEEEPGSSGKLFSDHLIRNVLFGYSAKGIRSTGKKEIRALPLSSLAESGNVYMVRGDWNKAFLDEVMVFPMGEHDDQVDAATGGFNFLAGGISDIGMIGKNPFAGKYAGDGISDMRRNRYR